MIWVLNLRYALCFCTWQSIFLYVSIAKGLNLYQVLAPNAYSYVKGYVSTINKNVKSKIYKKVSEKIV